MKNKIYKSLFTLTILLFGTLSSFGQTYQKDKILPNVIGSMEYRLGKPFLYINGEKIQQSHMDFNMLLDMSIHSQWHIGFNISMNLFEKNLKTVTKNFGRTYITWSIAPTLGYEYRPTTEGLYSRFSFKTLLGVGYAQLNMLGSKANKKIRDLYPLDFKQKTLHGLQFRLSLQAIYTFDQCYMGIGIDNTRTYYNGLFTHVMPTYNDKSYDNYLSPQFIIGFRFL